MYVCVCHAINERQVHQAVADGARSLSDLQAELGVATCCGSCAQTAQEYLPGGRYTQPAASAAQPARFTEVSRLAASPLSRVA